MANFKAMQQAYDVMEPPSYWDEDDTPVYERLQEGFDDDFMAYLDNEKIAELLLKICKQTASLNDFVEFKKEAANWYESELEKYSEDNYDKAFKQLKKEADEDRADAMMDW